MTEPTATSTHQNYSSLLSDTAILLTSSEDLLTHAWQATRRLTALANSGGGGAHTNANTFDIFFS